MLSLNIVENKVKKNKKSVLSTPSNYTLIKPHSNPHNAPQLCYNTPMNNYTNTKKMTIAALMAALALIFSYVEVLIPFTVGIPGIKLGIANIVVIIALYYLGPKYAITINVIRVLIAGLLFNGLFGALYSLAGALVSFIVMVALKKTNIFSVVGISMAGGVAHNLGQILIAAVLVANIKIFIYFPVLIISGVITGAIIGILAGLILKKLPKKDAIN